jgi:hypothetical protein
MKSDRFAQYDETLWVDVLRHYSQKGNACKAQIQEVLELIEADNALPPLMVVESLSSGALTTLDVCQEYLERQFASDFDVIHEDRKESEKCDHTHIAIPCVVVCGAPSSLFSHTHISVHFNPVIGKTQKQHRKRWTRN